MTRSARRRVSRRQDRSPARRARARSRRMRLEALEPRRMLFSPLEVAGVDIGPWQAIDTPGVDERNQVLPMAFNTLKVIISERTHFGGQHDFRTGKKPAREIVTAAMVSKSVFRDVLHEFF